jgi:general secretion pathway protein A
MYEAFFGLRERPFELTPNPRYLCRTPRHREALSNLEYGLTTARGITLLLGDAGTGKTTLIRTALESIQKDDSLCVSVTNPTLSRGEFVQYLAEQFQLGDEAAASKSVLLLKLERLLIERRERGALTALVIDEAQSLPFDLLEEVRLLANMETDEEKLLPLVLAGQPELAERLNDPSLRQLKQRVAVRCTLAPLELQETATYIAGRIRTAGGDSARLFTREAVELIYARSRGIPRTISVICDNALITAFAAGERPVTSRLVKEVCADFDYRGDQTAGPVEATPPVGTAAADPEERAPEEPVLEEQPAAGGTRARRFSFF